MMSNPFAKPKLPDPKPPTPMPDPDNPAIVEAKRREISKRLTSGGRQSTILTGRAREQNFDTYTSMKLGAG